MKDFTPTQQRMLAVLADGRGHTLEELRACLYDELGSSSNVWFHISRLRKQLQQRGENIATLKQFGTLYYFHVRRLGATSQG